VHFAGREIFIEGSFHDIDGINGDIVQGTVGAGGAHIGDIIHDLHAIDDLTEYVWAKSRWKVPPTSAYFLAISVAYSFTSSGRPWDW